MRIRNKTAEQKLFDLKIIRMKFEYWTCDDIDLARKNWLTTNISAEYFIVLKQSLI